MTAERRGSCSACGKTLPPYQQRGRCDECVCQSAASCGVVVRNPRWRGHRRVVDAACTSCGLERTVEVQALLRGRSTQCRSCARRVTKSSEKECETCGRSVAARRARPLCDQCRLEKARKAGVQALEVMDRSGRPGFLAACRSCERRRFVPQGEAFAGRQAICSVCRTDQSPPSTACSECGQVFKPRTFRSQVCDHCHRSEAERLGYRVSAFIVTGGRPGVIAACAYCGLERFIAMHQVRSHAAKTCVACRPPSTR